MTNEIAAQRVERNLASARAARWEEEVNILEEEMKRTVRFFAYKCSQWEKRAEGKEIGLTGNQQLGFAALCMR